MTRDAFQSFQRRGNGRPRGGGAGRHGGQGVEIALLSAPENIFYLIGLDHWGYFSPHVLIVPAEGDLVLITRQMEQAAIAAIHDGAREAEVAAECLCAMTRAGGTPPGFGPFLRPAARMAEEHTSRGDGMHRAAVFLEVACCVARYNAPMGRLVHIGALPDEDARMADLATRAFAATLDALKPGARARDVYDGWQAVVDAEGMAQYRRHHCGYVVGIGFPPSWTGGPRVTGLRHDSDLVMKTGMIFHLMSWFTGTGRENFFVSNTVLLGEGGAEVLNETAPGPHVA